MRYTARITDMMNAEILHNVDDRFTFSVINVHLNKMLALVRPPAPQKKNKNLLFNFSSLS